MNMNARGEIKPAAGVRQYYKLDPRPVRLKRKFDKWTDEAIKVFGFDQSKMKGVLK